MNFFLGVEIYILAIFSNSFFGFFIVYITNPLKKHKRKNILLVCSSINIGS